MNPTKTSPLNFRKYTNWQLNVKKESFCIYKPSRQLFNKKGKEKNRKETQCRPTSFPSLSLPPPFSQLSHSTNSFAAGDR